MTRIQLSSDTTIRSLYETVYKTLNLSDYGFSLFSNRDKGVYSNELRQSSKTLASSNLKNGNLVYFKQMAGSSVSSTLKDVSKCFAT